MSWLQILALLFFLDDERVDALERKVQDQEDKIEELEDRLDELNSEDDGDEVSDWDY